jgi:hypothetical protein
LGEKSRIPLSRRHSGVRRPADARNLFLSFASNGDKKAGSQESGIGREIIAQETYYRKR